MQPKPYDQLDPAELLALCVWREARGEKEQDARLAVAHTVLNRVKRPGWWGNTIHTVVLHPFQYSSFNTDDPNSTKWPNDNDPSWHASVAAAAGAIGGADDPTDGATHYYNWRYDEIPDVLPKGWGDPKDYRLKMTIARLRFYEAA